MATVFLVDDLDDVGVFFSIGIGNFAGVVLGAVIYKDDLGLLPGGQQRFYAAVHIGCGIITRYGKGDQLHNRPQFLGNTAQFPPDGLSTAPAAAARHLRCQNAR